MGVFDFVEDAVDSASDGARSFLGDAQEFFEKVGNFGAPEIGPSLLDKWTFIHDNPLTKLAGSPILAAAQVTVDGMKATTGWGEPEDGNQLEASRDEMTGAGHILVNADPINDRWDGSASVAYADKNSEHRHQVFDIATADEEIRTVIANEAVQIGKARQDLQDISDFLADFDTATGWMAFVPGGALLKVQLDMGAAATNVAAAAEVIRNLVSDTWDNAGKINAATERYQRAGDLPELEGTECTPFVNEHSAGHTPPSRTKDGPFTQPDYELPPGVYPPAVPQQNPAAPPSPAGTGSAAPTAPSSGPAAAPALSSPAIGNTGSKPSTSVAVRSPSGTGPPLNSARGPLRTTSGVVAPENVAGESAPLPTPNPTGSSQNTGSQV